ncbi:MULTISPECIES: sugar MFS transporter [unclassified Microbacterium]|uniref:MFS transporter n=1 Tax=unclassified Microbacterium TaxID=2609290 RepID=UPI0015E48790|nr:MULTISPECIES: MFS transporter [unclassified Microbacterium]
MKPEHPSAPPATSSVAPPGAFVRDGTTILSYAALGCYTFWLYAFGPAVTLLREELGFSYTLLGLYSVFWSLGAALAGATFTWAARLLTRGALLWTSAAGATLGAAIFTLTRGVPATLVGTVLFGLAGTMLLAVIQAVLSDQHGPRRDQALTEANIGAGASAVFAPLVLGALAITALGWRATFAFPVLVLALLFLRYRKLNYRRRPQRMPGTRSRRLPAACWMFAVLMAFSSAIEFCLVYFGPQVLMATGMSAAAASAALGANFLGILIGRMAGAVMTRRVGNTVPLLYGSLLVTAASFVLFWMTDEPLVAIVGLFVCGIGVANLYPLALALALDAAPGQEDQANARSQLVVGLVAAASPFVLGGLADQFGLFVAFAIEPVLIVAGVLLLWGGLRARRREAQAREEQSGVA